MDPQSRLTALRYVWTAFFGAMLVVNSSPIFAGRALDITNIIITLILAVAAVGSTGFIFNWGDLPAAESTRSETAKSKRRAKVDALLDLLNDEDLQSLRSRLEERPNPADEAVYLSDDGELVRKPVKGE